MSSSFRYTFTKLRNFPSSVKRCLRRSPNSTVSLPNASPTVFAGNSAESFFAAKTRSGVGMITFTGIFFSVFLFRCVPNLVPRSNRRAALDLNCFGRKLLAIVIQPPRSHILRLTFGDADDDVAVPRPCVLAIVFARARRMIRMRVIPPNDIQALLARHFFRFDDVRR